MRMILLGAILILISLASFAQGQSTTIYCSVNLSVLGGKRFEYGNLDKLLPDSVKAAVLVYPAKDMRLRNWNDLALWMSLHGWKLASWDAEALGFTGSVSTQSSLIFSRDIYLDEAARALVLDRVEKIEKSGQKKD
ncbi:MAG: hypothetical protein JST42_03695 [Bacteroidetes bacterium]|nr:hypothetical protein [Bacteroidota bacterium]